MPKKCSSCSSKDPAYKIFVMIQTVSFLCDQTMFVVPYAGLHGHFIRGECSWWRQFV